MPGKISRKSILNSLRGRLHLLVHCRLQSGTAGVNLSFGLLRAISRSMSYYCSVCLSVSMSVIASKREVSTQIGS